MTEPTEDQPTLPGLELGELRGPLREAVVITLAALEADGLLGPRHTAMAQLALTLADAVERGTYSGRASAAAMAAGQLRDTLLALPAPLEADVADRFNRFLLALEAEANQ
ncbi:hypothetical protein [Protaetiibacter larvae]|uniref:Uncharacterized protein n=1 Tax=Protaetiibacter larvae TaxID=2592654 RepID=A0A5C1Y4T5_9MICO|nr:hypothetical protein [Protaetiibacter larvae]QEO08894.1 hypothetical protein FLP23_01965 [Protaetiibacter larvae]